MNPPLVSVIIPTFNRAYCITESIRSVLAQSELEIIVVNDGSTDETVKELASFPTIQVINLAENHGVSYARNKGLEQARGSLICFLDSDDLEYHSSAVVAFAPRANDQTIRTIKKRMRGFK